MTQRSERIQLEKGSYENIIAGDLIEFPRKGYAHWAVYIGDKYVVHLTVDTKDAVKIFFGKIWTASIRKYFSFGGDHFKKAYIRKEILWNVAGENGSAFRNNGNDKYYRPRKPRKVASKAQHYMEEAGNKPVHYNAINSNCEHFVNYCRYNIIYSQQVIDKIRIVSNLVSFTLGYIVRDILNWQSKAGAKEPFCNINSTQN